MRVVVSASGAVVGLGDESLIAGEEQEVRDTALSSADFRTAEAQIVALGGLGEVWHDAATDTFHVRSRAKNTRELDDDDRRDLATRLQAALDNWASLTAAQKDALLRVCVRAALRTVR